MLQLSAGSPPASSHLERTPPSRRRANRSLSKHSAESCSIAHAQGVLGIFGDAMYRH